MTEDKHMKRGHMKQNTQTMTRFETETFIRLLLKNKFSNCFLLEFSGDWHTRRHYTAVFLNPNPPTNIPNSGYNEGKKEKKKGDKLLELKKEILEKNWMQLNWILYKLKIYKLKNLILNQLHTSVSFQLTSFPDLLPCLFAQYRICWSESQVMSSLGPGQKNLFIPLHLTRILWSSTYQ